MSYAKNINNKYRENKLLMSFAYKRILLSVLLLSLIIFMTVNQAAQANQRLMNYNDVFNMEFANNPQFHPTENFLVYERVSMDKYQDRQTKQLWLLDIDTKRHAPLLSASSTLTSSFSPVFSNDGRKIAFLSSTDNGIQIFVYWFNTKDLIQVSHLEKSPANLTWSPNNEQLAFTMFTPVKSKALFEELPKAPKGANWSQPAIFIDSVLYRGDGTGYFEKGFSQIYTISSEGGNANQVTQGSFNHNGPLAWAKASEDADSAMANRIYFSSNQKENWELEPLGANIFAIDTKTKDITQITDLTGPEGSVALSPNGKYIAFLHTNDRKLSYQVNQLMLMSVTKQEIVSLTPTLNRQIQDFKWQANSEGFVLSYADQGKTKIAELSTKGKFKKLDAELGSQSLGRPYVSGDFAVSANKQIVFTPNNPQSPAELALYQGQGKPTYLTSLNKDALENINVASTEAISINSSVDKLSISAWIAFPPNFDKNKQYPMILEIHGGPHAAYGNTFSLEVQLMAAKGYVVVWSNPRGSSSYGEDFANTIHHNYPSNDYQDLMDVVDAVIAKGYVNTKQLFVTGGSGGGVLTAWTVGKTNRFAAAVVAKPVINWMSFALTADAYPYFSQYWMPGKPWEIQDHLWQHSPLSLVGNVTTPTMLLTGESDYRTPISETEQYYQALQLAGVPTAMVRIPDSGHGIASRPTRLMQKVGNILAWFERYKSD